VHRVPEVERVIPLQFTARINLIATEKSATTPDHQRRRKVNQTEIFEKVIKILTPYVKNQEALADVTMSTHILDDLKVNSARLVDVVLEFEDVFEIEIDDDDVDSVETVGNAVGLIESKFG
jgi:acyl carrier protein